MNFSFQTNYRRYTDTTGHLHNRLHTLLPNGVEKDSDKASHNKIAWAKGARGVWGLANVFANGKLHFNRVVLEANNMPQGGFSSAFGEVFSCTHFFLP